MRKNMLGNVISGSGSGNLPPITNGLVAYFDALDINNNAWVDRVNGLTGNLSGFTSGYLVNGKITNINNINSTIKLNINKNIKSIILNCNVTSDNYVFDFRPGVSVCAGTRSDQTIPSLINTANYYENEAKVSFPGYIRVNKRIYLELTNLANIGVATFFSRYVALNNGLESPDYTLNSIYFYDRALSQTEITQNYQYEQSIIRG